MTAAKCVLNLIKFAVVATLLAASPGQYPQPGQEIPQIGVNYTG